MSARGSIATIASAVALAFVAGCGHGAGDGGEGAGTGGDVGPVVPVRVATLELRTFADQVRATGVWRSSGELVVAAPVAGVIESLFVMVGDRVAVGQRAGTLVTRDSWAAIRGAELLVSEARDATARDDARRALELARRELIRVPLILREAGAVVRRTVEPGAQVADGAEIVAVAPFAALVFEAHVPSTAASRVRAGQPAAILDAGTVSRPAKVARVLPMASSSDQASLIWLTPSEREPPPDLGRFGSAAITVGASHRAVALPDSSIVEDDLSGERRVAVVDAAGRLSWVVVTLGAGEAGWHEVIHPPPAAGTRVVIEGQRGLPEGTRVKPIP